MRLRLLLALSMMAFLVLVAACGGDSQPITTARPRTSGAPTPSGGGALPGDTFLTFDSQRYVLREVMADPTIPASDFTEIGAASQADIDYVGELKVYRRQGDNVFLYTYSPPAIVGGQEDAVPAAWLRWERAP
ncbi:MAG: hypothetical protein HYY03_06000 [Chloroflexi bacterium]|nr:hypothetical protein [Chloroflexota bacterium]